MATSGVMKAAVGVATKIRRMIEEALSKKFYRRSLIVFMSIIYLYRLGGKIVIRGDFIEEIERFLLGTHTERDHRLRGREWSSFEPW